MRRSDLSTLRKKFIWSSEWYDHINYNSLLFEDLKIKSYLTGIFYKLRLPTSLFKIRRVSNNFIIISMEIYIITNIFFKKIFIKQQNIYYLYYYLILFFKNYNLIIQQIIFNYSRTKVNYRSFLFDNLKNESLFLQKKKLNKTLNFFPKKKTHNNLNKKRNKHFDFDKNDGFNIKQNNDIYKYFDKNYSYHKEKSKEIKKNYNQRNNNFKNNFKNKYNNKQFNNRSSNRYNNKEIKKYNSNNKKIFKYKSNNNKYNNKNKYYNKNKNLSKGKWQKKKFKKNKWNNNKEKIIETKKKNLNHLIYLKKNHLNKVNYLKIQLMNLKKTNIKLVNFNKIIDYILWNSKKKNVLNPYSYYIIHNIVFYKRYLSVVKFKKTKLNINNIFSFGLLSKKRLRIHLLIYLLIIKNKLITNKVKINPILKNYHLLKRRYNKFKINCSKINDSYMSLLKNKYSILFRLKHSLFNYSDTFSKDILKKLDFKKHGDFYRNRNRNILKSVNNKSISNKSDTEIEVIEIKEDNYGIVAKKLNVTMPKNSSGKPSFAQLITRTIKKNRLKKRKTFINKNKKKSLFSKLKSKINDINNSNSEILNRTWYSVQTINNFFKKRTNNLFLNFFKKYSYHSKTFNLNNLLVRYYLFLHNISFLKKNLILLFLFKITNHLFNFLKKIKLLNLKITNLLNIIGTGKTILSLKKKLNSKLKKNIKRIYGKEKNSSISSKDALLRNSFLKQLDNRIDTKLNDYINLLLKKKMESLKKQRESRNIRHCRLKERFLKYMKNTTNRIKKERKNNNTKLLTLVNNFVLKKTDKKERNNNNTKWLTKVNNFLLKRISKKAKKKNRQKLLKKSLTSSEDLKNYFIKKEKDSLKKEVKKKHFSFTFKLKKNKPSNFLSFFSFTEINKDTLDKLISLSNENVWLNNCLYNSINKHNCIKDKDSFFNLIKYYKNVKKKDSLYNRFIFFYNWFFKLSLLRYKEYFLILLKKLILFYSPFFITSLKDKVNLFSFKLNYFHIRDVVINVISVFLNSLLNCNLLKFNAKLYDININYYKNKKSTNYWEEHFFFVMMYYSTTKIYNLFFLKSIRSFYLFMQLKKLIFNIEKSLSLYSNKSYLILPNYYYKGKPFLKSAKLLCEYICFKLEKGIWPKKVYRMIKSWQYLCNQWYKYNYGFTGWKRNNLRNLSGIRILVSGPFKKAKRKKKVHYHLWLRKYRVYGKMTLQSLKMNIDYYNLAVRFKDCTRGVKVWLLFDKLLKNEKPIKLYERKYKSEHKK